MATNRKPSNPWNQLSRKPQPKPAKPQRIPSTKALPPGQKGGAVTKPASNSNGGGTRSLPPGRPGGALARRPSATPTKPSATARQPRGGQIEKAGPTIDVKANSPKLSPGANRPTVRGGVSGAVRTGIGVAGATAVLAPVVAEAVRRATSQEFWNQASKELRDRQAQGAPGMRGVRAAATALSRGGRPGSANNTSRTVKPSTTKPTGKPSAKSPDTTKPKQPSTIKAPSSRDNSTGRNNSLSSSSNDTSVSSSSSTHRQVAAASTTAPQAPSSPSKQFNPNRGTSRTDNPLIKNDQYLMGKINQREQASADAAVASGKASKAEYNVSNNEGNRRLNEKSSSQQLSDTAKKIKDAADKSRASRQMSAGEQRYMTYLERQRKGQGNVIG